jgi:hypothetical protein
MVILDKTIKEAYLIYAAIPSSHRLHSTVTKKLRKYADFKEELIRIWKLKTACIVDQFFQSNTTFLFNIIININIINI